MKWIAPLMIILVSGCTTQVATSTHASQAHSQTGPAASAPGQGETEVLAEGVAAVQGPVDTARDSAIDDALRKAVEQGVGTFIDSETQVSNFQLISDNIYSRTRGYVSSYRIIDEDHSGGLYRVVVRAVVRTGDIEDDLAAIGILLSRQGRPRLMAVVREFSGTSGPQDDPASIGGEMFETIVLDHFRRRGFPVVDAATVAEILRKDQVRLILDGDDHTAVLLGLEAGAEIVIAGTAVHTAESREIAGSAREVHEYRVSTRAINTRTGAVLAGSAMTVALPFSESQARQRAADSTAIYLESAILRGWTGGENTTVVVVGNADYSKVQLLRSEIRTGVRGVIDVVTRDITGSRATIEVVSESPSAEVIDAVASLELTPGFEVTGMSGNRLEIRFND